MINKIILIVEKQQKLVVVIILGLALIIALLISRGHLKLGPALPKKPAPTAFVTITKNGFNPQTILINKGETVGWINEDSKAHQPASNPYPINNGLAGFDAKKPLKKGEIYTFTFEKSGTFGYHDQLHPTTNGSVVVK